MLEHALMQLNKNSKDPMYIQLYMQLKERIENGEYNDDQRLPAIRAVAQQLGINNSTVINAYKLLESSGYAYSRPGSGTYIMRISKSKESPSEYNIIEKSEFKIRSNSIDFSSSTPDPGLFPVESFKNVINEILDRDGGQAFGYTEIKGYRPLRESLAQYMNKFNIVCRNDNIQIVSGAQQGIDIIAKVLIDYGDIIITEEPTYTGAIAVFKSRGARIFGISIGSEGIDILKLENTLREIKPRFIYIMTNFQNPTGFSYSSNTREKLLFLAEKYDFYIIEDDYLSELYYNGKETSLLKSIDLDDRVIYIKSFSKLLMPGIRLGFIIAPERIRERILAAKHLSDISSSGFMQRVFDLYIRRNMMENHMENIKQEYHKRYNTIIDCIDSNMADISYYKPGGGIHLWLEMPSGMSSNILYSLCASSDIMLSPGSIFFADQEDSSCFRLSYVSTDMDKIKTGIKTIGKIFNDLKVKI